MLSTTKIQNLRCGDSDRINKSYWRCRFISNWWSFNNNHWFIFNIWGRPINNFIILSILIAAITKRAQIPFSRWLPAAMAAPTPVSALVHSSTLVTAGVFLTIRFFPFLNTLPSFSSILFFTSSLTIFMAGMSALTECDIKKIIALSTLRQLGVIILSLSLGFPKLAFFHLITHALFKALLFICAGSIIHYHAHGQDLRTIGILPQLPFTIALAYRQFLIVCHAFSCRILLERFNPRNCSIQSYKFLFSFVIFFGTMFTSAYSTRLTIFAVWTPNISFTAHHISNHDFNISLPVLMLSLGAIFSGALINCS